MLKHLLFVAILVSGGIYFWNMRPITHGPGVVAPNKPIQKNAFGIKPIEYKNSTLTPYARLEIEVRVLSKKRYYEQDEESNIAPFDFVVGWGPMSDERNLDKILIKQSDRSFAWEMITPPVAEHEMNECTYLIRLIPSNNQISENLEDIREGHVIHLKGYLVKIDSHNKSQIITTVAKKVTIANKEAKIIWVRELEIY